MKEQLFLPNWFVSQIEDATLLSLDVFQREPSGLWVRLDEQTAKRWRRDIDKGNIEKGRRNAN